MSLVWILAKKNRIFQGINPTVIADEKSGVDADKSQNSSFVKLHIHNKNIHTQVTPFFEPTA